jgi:hypothetical protein
VNTEHPSDLFPLSYGASLALGLFLILGLPRERHASGGGRRTRSAPAGLTEADLPAPAVTMQRKPRMNAMFEGSFPD